MLAQTSGRPSASGAIRAGPLHRGAEAECLPRPRLDYLSGTFIAGVWVPMRHGASSCQVLVVSNAITRNP